MIGVFDSGVGGLTILKSINKKLPEYSTIYLGDNARAPFGDLSREQITAYTWEGVQFLFEAGCSLVILACNTASAESLRIIQQEYLKDSDKKVLGIIRPTVEAMAELGYEKLGVLATKATVESGVYAQEFKEQGSDLQVFQQACPGWVMLIESGEGRDNASEIIKSDVEKLIEKDADIDAVLLACTHYPVFHDQVVRSLPVGVRVYDQGDLVAEKLIDYIKRHPEIDSHLDRSGKQEFYTTGEAKHVSQIVSAIAGGQIDFKHVDLNA